MHAFATSDIASQGRVQQYAAGEIQNLTALILKYEKNAQVHSRGLRLGFIYLRLSKQFQTAKRFSRDVLRNQVN